MIPIHLPPLRERTADIPMLINHFLDKFGAASGRNVKNVHRVGAAEALLVYGWPGNVRELENLVERLVVLKRDEMIDEPDLPEKVAGGGVVAAAPASASSSRAASRSPTAGSPSSARSRTTRPS